MVATPLNACAPEVGDRQIQRALAGELLRLLQHVVAVARTQARIDDQRRIATDDDADVGNDLNPPIGNDKDAADKFDRLALHNWWRRRADVR